MKIGKFDFLNRVKENKRNAVSEVSVNPAELLKENFVNCSWPNLYYDRLDAIIKLCKPENLVEIGVAYGYHAADILTKNESVNYVGIDPFVFNYDPNDGFCKDVENLFSKPGQEAMDLLFETVQTNLDDHFIGRAKLIRLPSVTASQQFDDQSLDFLFIDGDHRFAAVLADLESWYPKVRPGGVLTGDDWNWKSVSDAVKKFANDLELEIILVQDTKSDHTLWLIRK